MTYRSMGLGVGVLLLAGCSDSNDGGVACAQPTASEQAAG